MKCRDCQTLLQAQLDGLGTPASPEWRAHLAECKACREDWQAGQTLTRGLAFPKKSGPTPQTLTTRIVTKVLDDRRKRLWRTKTRWAAVWTLAASVLVIVGLSTFFSKRNDAVVKPIEQSPVELASVPKIEQSVTETRQAFASLGNRIADRTREDALLLWIAATPKDLPRAPTTDWELDPTMLSIQQTGQALSEGVRPMTRSAAQALGFFSRELTSFDLSAAQ